MAAAPIVTSRGKHHEAFALGRLHVLELATHDVTLDEVDSVFAARKWMEEHFPDGHAVILDFRAVHALPSLETRDLVGVHARVQRPGQVRARAIVLPPDPEAATLVRAFVTAYTHAPGVRCPDRFVRTLEEARAFVEPFVGDDVDFSCLAPLAEAVRARLANHAAYASAEA